MNEDMNVVSVWQLSGAEEEHYLDELFETIQAHVLTLPEETIDAVLERLKERQHQLETDARRLRSQHTDITAQRCRELERLARRFYHVRYAVYRLLQPRHPHYTP
jgi:hypothetical protein